MRFLPLSAFLLFALGILRCPAESAFQPDAQYTNDFNSARARLFALQPQLATNRVEQLAATEARSNRLAQILPELLWQPAPDFTNAAALLKEFPGSLDDLRRYGQPLLYSAVNENRTLLVDFLLEQGARPDLPAHNQYFPLEQAIERRHWDLAAQLIQAGADVMRTNLYGRSPAGTFFERWYPRTYGNANDDAVTNLVALMFARGLDPFAPVPHGQDNSIIERCLGHEAGYWRGGAGAAGNYILLSEMLLTNNPSPARRTPRGDTALHLAVADSRTNVVQFLLGAGFSVNQTNDAGLTALQQLVGGGGARLLLEPGTGGRMRGAVTNEQTMADWLLSRDASLDVFSAAGLGRTNELARLLAAQPALANTRDGYGRTPLHYAVANADAYVGGPQYLFPPAMVWGSVINSAPQVAGWRAGGPLSVPPAVLLLLDAGADPSAATTLAIPPGRNRPAFPSGTTPLQLAAARGNAPLLLALLNAKADVRAADADGNTALHFAASGSSSNAVELLIRAQAPLNVTNLASQTPIRRAAESGSFVSVGLLLDAGANPTNGLNGDTLLHIAAARGDLNTAKLLLKRGFGVNAPDAAGQTPFQRAVLARQHQMFRWLLDEGARLNATDPDGNTVLHLLSAQQQDMFQHQADESLLNRWHRERVSRPGFVGNALRWFEKNKLLTPPTPFRWTNSSLTLWLINEGASARATNRAGQSPLHVVCRQQWLAYDYEAQNTNRLFALLNGGARLDQPDTNGVTPLHLAVTNASLACFKLMLAKAGPEVLKLKDQAGRTLLHTAVAGARDRFDNVAALLSAGADPNATDQQGVTPLHLAVPIKNDGYAWQRQNLLLTLLTNGANPNIRDAEGQTPLLALLNQNNRFAGHFAANFVTILLTNNADPNIVDRDGNTLLHRAFTFSTNRMSQPPTVPVPLLVKHGASLSATNRAGLTPLHLLAQGPPHGLHTAGIFDRMISVTNAAFAVRDPAGDTPLHIWARTLPYCSTCAEQLGKLLAANDSFNLTNTAGDTPFTLFLNSSNVTWLGRVVIGNRFASERLAVCDREGNPLLHRLLAAMDSRYGDMQQFLRLSLTNTALANLTNAAGDTPLHIVLRRRDVYTPRLLMQAGADPTRRNARGETPLLLATIHLPNGPFDVRPAGARMPFFNALQMRDPAEAFRWLDADPGLAGITNKDGQTPLVIATARNATALIERLLQLGAPLDPLSALRLGRTEDFSRLLAARTNQPPPDDWLFEAVRCGQSGPLREMIAAGANPHAVDAEGHSLLFRAMAGQPEDMVEELNRQQCRATLFDAAVNGDVARLDAAFAGQPEAVNTTNRNGLTLLYSAASAGQLKIVESLLARGARADAVMPGGWTALHAAVVSDRADIALLLLNAGASPNVFGSGGMAPLHLAAASGATNTAELLLARGAAVNALPPEPDEYRGNAPLHWAAHLGKLDMFKLLLAHGADVNLLNGRKLTPLQYAQLTAREHWGFPQPPGTQYQHDDTMFRSESRDAMLVQLEAAADSRRQ